MHAAHAYKLNVQTCSAEHTARIAVDSYLNHGEQISIGGCGGGGSTDATVYVEQWCYCEFGEHWTGELSELQGSVCLQRMRYGIE